MFISIFRYELQHWLRQPVTYVYAALFFFLALGSMWGRAAEGAGTGRILNSPVGIQTMVSYFNQLILFLSPAIIGGAIYRDFRHRMHAVLYAYPLTKRSYLPAKLLSALVVTFLIVSTAGWGMYAGTLMPGVDPGRLGPFRMSAYLQTFFVFVLPTLLLFGGIVFSIVTFTRSIYAGFVAMVLLLLLQGLTTNLLRGLEDQFMAAVLDPFGQRAVDYTIRYWTLAEQNERFIPLSKAILYNRILWLVAAVLVLAGAYRLFSFHQTAFSFAFLKKRRTGRSVSRLENRVSVDFSPVQHDFSFWQNWRTTWRLSVVDFKYVVTDRVFLILLGAGLLFIFVQQAELKPQYGIRTLPVTWKMLQTPTFLFLGVIQVLTFLYAGMLAHRARIANVFQMVDLSPVPGWVWLCSRFIALVKMQVLLLFLIMIGGISVQLYYGYDRLEIGHYLFELLILRLPGLVIWACVAVFIQHLFGNPYLGFFLLLLGALGITGLPELGVEAYVFRYNTGPAFTYSDLDGYGRTLPAYLLYKLYWGLFGLFLFLGALCWQPRGLTYSFAERFRLARARVRGKVAGMMAVLLAAFLVTGSWLYGEEKTHRMSQYEEDQWRAENEKRYKRYEDLAQPRIVAVRINMDLYPYGHAFRAEGAFLLVNRSGQTIDTLLINYPPGRSLPYQFSEPTRLISRDTLYGMDLCILSDGLSPGDSLSLLFTLPHAPDTWLDRSSLVRKNGTYFDNSLFPALGYRPQELTDNGKRARYGLPERSGAKPYPSDSSALFNSYSSRSADWIDFEAVVSTSADQIALAPGYLQREWLENGRRYFHYKMDSPIKDYYGFNAGRFVVRRDRWRNIALEVYHYPAHDRNVTQMLQGLKGALAYSERHFGPYQHRQARIIEFPVDMGRFATTFANSIPFSEIYFIMDTDTTKAGAVDLPLYVSAHEMAHQWWGNQLLPADVLGAKMLTESLAEYTALKVLEAEYGQRAMRNFLKLDLDLYLRGRGEAQGDEMPLIYTRPGQEYIHYRKGALVFYALCDYLGEARLNGAIRDYLAEVRFQEAPYTTSLELLEYLRGVTPDSLQYLIEDLFETVTLYDNKMVEVHATRLENGQYRVDLEFFVCKYRSDGRGNRHYDNSTGRSLAHHSEKGKASLRSLPLADYIEIGIFGEPETGAEPMGAPLHLARHRITGIHNRQSIVVDQRPAAVGIDPFHKLIDADPDDNLVYTRQDLFSDE